jgi:TolA-binding protein
MDLGKRYLEADQPQKAEECLQAALSAAPQGDLTKQFEARFALCDLHFDAMNDPEKARADYEKLRADFPKADPGRRREALIRIGDTYRDQAKTDEALKAYKEAESDPAFLPEQPRQLVVAAQLEAVESYLHRGEAQEAGKRLDELLWHYPTLRLEGRPATFSVQAALQQGNYKEARRQADVFIAFSKDANYLPSVHLYDAQACGELGLSDQAADHYRKIVDKFPEAPEAPEAQAALKKLGE